MAKIANLTKINKSEHKNAAMQTIKNKVISDTAYEV